MASCGPNATKFLVFRRLPFIPSEALMDIATHYVLLVWMMLPSGQWQIAQPGQHFVTQSACVAAAQVTQSAPGENGLPVRAKCHVVVPEVPEDRE